MVCATVSGCATPTGKRGCAADREDVLRIVREYHIGSGRFQTLPSPAHRIDRSISRWAASLDGYPHMLGYESTPSDRADGRPDGFAA